MKTSLKTLEKIMISLDSKVDDYLGDQLSDEQKEEKWICESSFYLFLEKIAVC
jgi:hypothetical protein